MVVKRISMVTSLFLRPIGHSSFLSPIPSLIEVLNDIHTAITEWHFIVFFLLTVVRAAPSPPLLSFDVLSLTLNPDSQLLLHLDKRVLNAFLSVTEHYKTAENSNKLKLAKIKNVYQQ